MSLISIKRFLRLPIRPQAKTLRKWSMILGGGLAICFAAIAMISVFSSRPDVKTQVDLAMTALEITRQTGRLVYDADAFTARPYEVEDIQGQKVLFLARMLPRIVAENERIRKQRARLLHNPSLAEVNALALAYGLKPNDVDRTALLQRVDTVPVSLILAQAAIESAWGTSRFAREGRAFFGQHTTDPDAPGIKPLRASGFKVKSFETAQASVRAYLKTLNTHPAYEDMRLRRATLRALGERISGADLVHHLMAYSELGSIYITRITDTITSNRLREFDDLRFDNN